MEEDAPTEVSTISSTESPSHSSPSRPPWLTTTLASVTEKAAYRFVASHARRTVAELSDPTDGGSSTIAGDPARIEARAPRPAGFAKSRHGAPCRPCDLRPAKSNHPPAVGTLATRSSSIRVLHASVL